MALRQCLTAEAEALNEGLPDDVKRLGIEAAIVIQRSVGGDKSEHASRVYRLANIYRLQGNYAQAEPLAQQALRIWGRGGERTKGYADALNVLGSIYIGMEDYTKAEDALERARQAEVKIGGADSGEYAAVTTNLGWAHMRLGDSAKAKAEFRKAADCFAKNGDDRNYALVLDNLALATTALKEYDAAEPLYRTASNSRKKPSAKITISTRSASTTTANCSRPRVNFEKPSRSSNGARHLQGQIGRQASRIRPQRGESGRPLSANRRICQSRALGAACP